MVSLASRSALLLLMCVCAKANAVPSRSLAKNAPFPLLCTDVGVQMWMPRTASMPLEELSELQTGKSCAKTVVMTTVADAAMRALKQTDLQVLDCVTTRINEEVLGLYAVICVCSRNAEDTVPMKLPQWEALVRPQLDRIFGSPRAPASARGVELQYHGAKIECLNLVIAKSYLRDAPSPPSGGDNDNASDEEAAPRFKYKSSELWTDSVPSNQEGSATLVSIKLKVKNDGSAPLHLFAATLKSMDEEAPSNGLMVLSSDRVDAVAPSKVASVVFTFQSQTPFTLVEDANYAVYFAHTAARAHILEGKLDGKKLKINDKKKTRFSSLSKTKKDFGNHQLDDAASSLAGLYASVPYGMWQLLSVAIVMVVGIATTLYMRRKATRVNWSKSLDCFNPHKQKRSKMTEMTKPQKKASYDPQQDDAEVDALESDSFLSSTTSSSVDQPSPLTKPPIAAKLREKMPSITMQWRKPDALRDLLSTRRVLKLDTSARLDAKQFETLWDQFLVRHNESFHAEKERPSSDVVLQTMRKVGILCMASGQVDGVEKYILYAKQSDTNDYLFAALDIFVATSETTLSIRASKDASEALVQQFTTLMGQQVHTLLQ